MGHSHELAQEHGMEGLRQQAKHWRGGKAECRSMCVLTSQRHRSCHRVVISGVQRSMGASASAEKKNAKAGGAQEAGLNRERALKVSQVSFKHDFVLCCSFRSSAPSANSQRSGHGPKAKTLNLRSETLNPRP